MALNQPGETLSKSEKTSLGGAPPIEMKPAQLSPLMSGHTVSATVSTPGTPRRCSTT